MMLQMSPTPAKKSRSSFLSKTQKVCMLQAAGVRKMDAISVRSSVMLTSGSWRFAREALQEGFTDSTASTTRSFLLLDLSSSLAEASRS